METKKETVAKIADKIGMPRKRAAYLVQRLGISGWRARWIEKRLREIQQRDNIDDIAKEIDMNRTNARIALEDYGLNKLTGARLKSALIKMRDYLKKYPGWPSKNERYVPLFEVAYGCGITGRNYAASILSRCNSRAKKLIRTSKDGSLEVLRTNVAQLKKLIRESYKKRYGRAPRVAATAKRKSLAEAAKEEFEKLHKEIMEQDAKNLVEVPKKKSVKKKVTKKVTKKKPVKKTKDNSFMLHFGEGPDFKKIGNKWWPISEPAMFRIFKISEFNIWKRSNGTGLLRLRTAKSITQCEISFENIKRKKFILRRRRENLYTANLTRNEVNKMLN